MSLRAAIQADPDQLDDTICMYRPCGVFRVTHEPSDTPHQGLVFARANELSLRYPSVHTDLSRRQAE